MKKEIKRKWIANLKSGKFKQSTGKLTRDGYSSFCCLGVLCEALNIEKSPNEGYKSLNGYGYMFSEIDPATRKKIGLTKTQHSKLAQMNDIEHKSFTQIANWIHQNIKGK